MKTKYFLERHLYAKEMNKLYALRGNKKILLDCITDKQKQDLALIGTYKDLVCYIRKNILNKPTKTVKHVKIYKHNSLERLFDFNGLLTSGIANNYQEILDCAYNRHIKKNNGILKLIVAFDREQKPIYQDFKNIATCTYKIKMITI